MDAFCHIFLLAATTRTLTGAFVNAAVLQVLFPAGSRKAAPPDFAAALRTGFLKGNSPNKRVVPPAAHGASLQLGTLRIQHTSRIG
jgi:hypothetical protein